MANYVAQGYVNAKYFQTGITVYWGQRKIFVPKSELTLVQSVPTEIYNLDINAFRLALKDLEDDAEGMAFVSTHSHNTSVVLSGVTYARVVELINDYVVEFEDGNYAVNLINANSNIADKIIVNSVSVRASNSAGLIVYSGSSPSTTDVANAVWAHSSATTALADIAFIKHIEGGRWKIVSNQMIFYRDDNVTEVARFDLKDSSGSPTMSNPMERSRV